MAVSPVPRALGRGLGLGCAPPPRSRGPFRGVSGLVLRAPSSPRCWLGALTNTLRWASPPAGTPAKGHRQGGATSALTVAGASAVVGPLVIAVGPCGAGLVFGMSAAWWAGPGDACVSFALRGAARFRHAFDVVVRRLLHGRRPHRALPWTSYDPPGDPRRRRAQALKDACQPVRPPYLASTVRPMIGRLCGRTLRQHARARLLSGLSSSLMPGRKTTGGWQLALRARNLAQNPAAAWLPAFAIIITATRSTSQGTVAERQERER